MLTKGAEEAIFPVCNSGEMAINEANRILGKFANKGWRTLVLAYKVG